MKLISIAALSIFISSQVFAGQIASAKVTQIRVDRDGRGMVVFDRAVNNNAGCIVPSYTNALAFDNSTGGKAVLAMALAAKATDRPITAYGAGTCNVYGGSYVEDWSYGIEE